MKILLTTPPLVQPNTPYAATPLLTAWLRDASHEAVQADLSLELLLRLFSEQGISELCRELADRPDMQAFVAAEADYCETIAETMAFLQNQEPGSAKRIARRGWLPEGPALQAAWRQERQLRWNFRGLDETGRAQHLASLYLDDLAEAAKAADPHFGFSRYAESLAVGLPSFEPLRRELEADGSFFVRWLDELALRTLSRHQPRMLGLTVPFPGCLFAALRIARTAKRILPDCHVVLGGGYANTELRELRDPAVFDYVDSIVLDDGIRPMQRLVEFLEGRIGEDGLVSTFQRRDGQVRFFAGDAPPVFHGDLPAPVYDGLPMDRYFGLFEALNPVMRLWSDGRWNKLALAHGCCWSRCAFCDTSVDYIRRYDPACAATVCDWIEAVQAETGFDGFHFVDEALPPELLDAVCDEILRRGLRVQWWGNLRFEKRITRELARKMAAAGCIAVTGGLETCCDRTLRLMCKGIAVDQAERVLADLAEEGIMTHAYLMYGFPTQTLKETLDALETVRGFFDRGILHSAFWHRFALTAHSPMAQRPEEYSIIPGPSPEGGFAANEIPFEGRFDHDLDAVGEALRCAAYNYQLGIGLDRPVESWLR